jgi:hypothetical protein
MTTEQNIAFASLIASVVIGVISWVVSARIARKSFRSPKLNYRLSMSPLLSKSSLSATSGLKIEYNGELLVEPTLLSVDIINAGDIAIENPPIEIEAVGATYVIPGYFEDVPPGYEALWSIERTDAEACAIHLAHINPKQVAKVRFFLDENPKEEPIFKCPMKNLTVKRVNSIMTADTANLILSASPYPARVLAEIVKRLRSR